ncbi:MAG TPA: hypothetical protein PK191_01365 [Niabella sp.]|nr:hypothetical protein [Niabella sp.]HOZ97723.1 hypothetical protein [Niabella sp.]HQW14038.1 hypothetical protein [Niabella sp.]HQX19419.1 hypothetical protein [Niabella sp.]HQX40228.1 hypothetical protein [Niabella sp.]
MTDIAKIFMQQVGLKSSPFTVSSRYHSVEITTIEGKKDVPIAYVKRRMISSPDKFYVIQKYQTTEGDRPDLLGQKFYNDPERFWQICDANVTLDPEELISTPGNTIHISLPNGIPGNNNA